MQLWTPASLEKGLKIKFLEYFQSEVSLASQIAYVESSDSDEESYDWLGQAPAMSEVRAGEDITVTPLSNTKYTITNKVFSASIAISRSDLADNKTGSINRRIQQMAAAAAGHANKLLIDALVGNGNCYDGAAMFNVAHPVRGDEGGTQSNLLTGTGTTTAQVATDIASAKASLLKFKDEGGRPFAGDGAMSLAVVCPPDIEKQVREALNAQIISNTSNVMQGAADVIVSPRLTDANDFYVLRTDTARALILQEREPVEFSALEGSSDSGFMREQYLYKVRSRLNAGFAHWSASCKVSNS
jgi:phage major head subunit gpT-like protein